MAQNVFSKAMTGIAAFIWSGGRVTEALSVPSARHEECNVTSADVVPTMQNCRCVYSNTAGRVKVDYLDDDDGSIHTEIIDVSPAFVPVRNVTKVYRYLTGTTVPTSKIRLAADDSEVVGLKLRR